MLNTTNIEHALSSLWHAHSPLIIWVGLAIIVAIVVGLGFASYAIQDTQSRRKRIAEERTDIRGQQIKKLMDVGSFADLEELGKHLLQCQNLGATDFMLDIKDDRRVISLTKAEKIGNTLVLHFERREDKLKLALVLNEEGKKLDATFKLHPKGQESISGTFTCNDVQVRPLMNLGELKLTLEGLGECSLWFTKK